MHSCSSRGRKFRQGSFGYEIYRKSLFIENQGAALVVEMVTSRAFRGAVASRLGRQEDRKKWVKISVLQSFNSRCWQDDRNPREWEIKDKEGD